MKKNSTAVLTFNSMQITLSVVSDKNGFGCLEYSAKNVYSGVNKSFFVAPNEIEGLIVDLDNRYASYSGKHISRLTIVLPQHFFRLIPSVQSIETKGTVTEADIRSLRKKVKEPPLGYVALNETEGGFSVENEGSFSTDVIGKEGKSVQFLSVSLALSSNVHELFKNISKNLRMEFSFVPPCAPIIEKLNRDGKNRGLLLKVNQLSSDLVYFENKLAVSSISLSYGSFHFVDALAHKFNISFESADELLSHINLGLSLNDEEYVVSSPLSVKKYSVAAANETLIELLDFWGNETRSAVEGLVEKADLPIYAIGSSIIKIHGFSEILSSKTGRNVQGVYPDFSVWNTSEEYLHCALFENY